MCGRRERRILESFSYSNSPEIINKLFSLQNWFFIMLWNIKIQSELYIQFEVSINILCMRILCFNMEWKIFCDLSCLIKTMFHINHNKLANRFRVLSSHKNSRTSLSSLENIKFWKFHHKNRSRLFQIIVKCNCKKELCQRCNDSLSSVVKRTLRKRRQSATDFASSEEVRRIHAWHMYVRACKCTRRGRRHPLISRTWSIAPNARQWRRSKVRVHLADDIQAT